MFIGEVNLGKPWSLLNHSFSSGHAVYFSQGTCPLIKCALTGAGKLLRGIHGHMDWALAGGSTAMT